MPVSQWFSTWLPIAITRRAWKNPDAQAHRRPLWDSWGMRPSVVYINSPQVAPAGVVQLVEALSCTLKCCAFHPWLGESIFLYHIDLALSLHSFLSEITEHFFFNKNSPQMIVTCSQVNRHHWVPGNDYAVEVPKPGCTGALTQKLYKNTDSQVPRPPTESQSWNLGSSYLYLSKETQEFKRR